MSDNSWDKDWLVFSRKSRRGIFVLLFIFAVVAVFPRVYRNYFMDKALEVQIASLSLEEKKTDVPKFENNFEKRSVAKKNQKQKTFKYNIPSKPFDPNTYSFEDWKAIGFSEKQVQTILNYRENGGQFKVKEDVKKLYVIGEELYSDLYDVIDLPDTISSSNNRDFPKEKITYEKITLNINTATKEELKEVSGIGNYVLKSGSIVLGTCRA